MTKSQTTLDNCAHEPIHIPGSIQPHGALLVFNEALQITGWSTNTLELLGLQPQLHAELASLALCDEINDVIRELRDYISDGEASPIALECSFAGRTFDLVAHAHLHRIIVEFERRDRASDEVASFALKAHRAIDRIKRQKSIPVLLQMAVEEVEKLTGFNRVMAYIFHPDDSGDVVAEQCHPQLDPYLGRRYPASDIPAQARRLYTLNTLRLIANTGYQPVAVVGDADAPPLDMSHCVLRSVSPIHIEYLRNMGVSASMSVSIIINGRLWGMIACHHMAPLQIPYSIRMACDVIAQIIASTVASLQEHERAEQKSKAAAVRTELLETLMDKEDTLGAMAQHAEALTNTLGADALVLSQAGKTLVFGSLSQSLAADIINELPSKGEQILLRQTRSEWPKILQQRINKWVGLLALQFDPVTNGWILALRLEQVETVTWGGKQDKTLTPGPLGPRLTPRGSFDEWKEVVRDSAVPWEQGYLESARELLSTMVRATSLRHAETDRARSQLMAILGHDLRDPLNSINLAAHFLEQQDSAQKMGSIIRTSSGRMQRLIGQVLDMSRLGTGIGLGIKPIQTDVATIVRDMIDEARMAYPNAHYEVNAPAHLLWNADPDRLAQAIGNLLGNARIHGASNAAIAISLQQIDTHLLIEVANQAAPVDEKLVPQLFAPFKKSSGQARDGLGLGLYIAHQIVAGHKGELSYDYREPQVIFRISLPATRGATL